jgi:hypothetical protein
MFGGTLGGGEVVVDQFVTERGPAPPGDGGPPGHTEQRPPLRIARQRGDGLGEAGRLERRHQVSGPVRLHQVTRATGVGRHHRQSAGHGLLHGLPERLVRAGVREHVETRVDAGQLLPPAYAQEPCLGQGLVQHVRRRAVTDHDQLDPRQAGDLRQEADLFLDREPADESDQHLTVRGERPANAVAAMPRMELNVIDASPP